MVKYSDIYLDTVVLPPVLSGLLFSFDSINHKSRNILSSNASVLIDDNDTCNHLIQSQSSYRASFSSNTDKVSILFDGLNDFYLFSNNITLSDFTIFACFKMISLATLNASYLVGNPSSPHLLGWDDPLYGSRILPGGYFSSPLSSSILNTRQIFCWRRNGSNIAQEQNNVSVGGVLSNSNPMLLTTLGDFRNPSPIDDPRGWNGHIYSFLIYDRELVLAERNLVYSFLNSRFM